MKTKRRVAVDSTSGIQSSQGKTQQSRVGEYPIDTAQVPVLSPSTKALGLSDSQVAEMSALLNDLDFDLDKACFLIDSLLASLVRWKYEGFPTEEHLDQITNGATLLYLDYKRSIRSKHAEAWNLWTRQISPAITRIMGKELEHTEASANALAEANHERRAV